MEERTKSGLFLYLLLAGIFISLLVTCNLIFQKFFTLNLFGIHTFNLSVGLIPYPLTFLVTDLISEIFGRKRANQVVIVGLICAVLVMLVVVLADIAPIMQGSPVSNEEFNKVFGFTAIAVGASMIAYLCAQFIDIRVFHFWKDLTQGKHLWLRNNFSTITSQLVDTTVIFTLLCSFGVIPWELYGSLFASSMLFKIIVAVLDTPLFYLFTSLIKKHYKLGINDELKI